MFVRLSHDTSGDPVSIDLDRPREWSEAIRLHFYNQENELLLHGKGNCTSRGMKKNVSFLTLYNLTACVCIYVCLVMLSCYIVCVSSLISFIFSV